MYLEPPFHELTLSELSLQWSHRRANSFHFREIRHIHQGLQGKERAENWIFRDVVRLPFSLLPSLFPLLLHAGSWPQQKQLTGPVAASRLHMRDVTVVMASKHMKNIKKKRTSMCGRTGLPCVWGRPCRHPIDLPLLSMGIVVNP